MMTANLIYLTAWVESSFFNFILVLPWTDSSLFSLGFPCVSCFFSLLVSSFDVPSFEQGGISVLKQHACIILFIHKSSADVQPTKTIASPSRYIELCLLVFLVWKSYQLYKFWTFEDIFREAELPPVRERAIHAITCTVCVFCERLSVYVYASFSFALEGGM